MIKDMGETYRAFQGQFCCKTFQRCAVAELADFEKLYNFEFPDDYKTFICEYNGGVYQDAEFITSTGRYEYIDTLYGFDTGLNETNIDENYINLFLGSILVPIGVTTTGSLLLISSSKSDCALYLKVPYDRNVVFISTSFFDFILSVHIS